MIKVKVEKLKAGDVIAEDIANFERKVLLSAGITLTDNNIALLKLWEIDEIRLREENETDDSIRLSLQFDEIIQTNVSLFDNLKTSIKAPIVLSSIIRKKSLQQYNDITQKITQIFSNISNSKNAELLVAISNILCQYVITTPCVIGYTLQRPFKHTRHEHLINHSMSVAIIAAKIAKLLGYAPEEIQTIVLGALLHDIGKTKLPDRIANRNGCSSSEDETLYQSHIQVGYDLIKSLDLPREVTLIIVQHHEYNDGSGFPLHLTTDKIHPYALIVAFADMFDTLVHERNELPNFFDIRTRLLRNGANKFSTTIIDIFDHYLKDFIFNINVELTDGRKAEVIYTHPSYLSLVVHTTDGDVVDLGKNKDVYIKKTFL